MVLLGVQAQKAKAPSMDYCDTAGVPRQLLNAGTQGLRGTVYSQHSAPRLCAH
jgi:hypothetical protein